MIFQVLSIALRFMDGYRFVNEAKKKGLLAYLKLLQTLRKSIVGALFVVFALQIFIFSIVGFFLAGLYLSPLETETKVWILFSTCGFIITIVAIILSHLFSEKTWLNLSGVKDQISK